MLNTVVNQYGNQINARFLEFKIIDYYVCLIILQLVSILCLHIYILQAKKCDCGSTESCFVRLCIALRMIVACVSHFMLVTQTDCPIVI